MATVYLAEDLKHHRKVAVKVMRPELSATLGTDRFVREVEIAAQLNHPNILPMFDSGEAGGLLYYVMPYVEGETLQARLRRDGPLSVDDALTLTREICEALAYAHERGIVHRDMKPANILLNAGHALVADFGIARAVGGGGEALTRTGIAIGTPHYMSPEQASGDPGVDARTDIYAVGCILYEMLVGEPPFNGPSAQAIISRSMTETPRALTQSRPGLSPRLNALVFRAIAKGPADRYPTAQAMADAIRGFQTSGESGAVASAPAGLASILSWRKAIGAGLAALVVWAVIATVMAVKGPKSASKDGVRLAVMPFENRGEPGDAYFADGIADEVRGKLTSLAGFRVTARASSDQYRKTDKSLKQIGSELGVDYILTATVRWLHSANGKGRVQVTPELINTGNGDASWQQSFDADVTDVFQVQSEIASKVAVALGVALGKSDEQALKDRPTNNVAAYDLFLRGRAIPSPDPVSLKQRIGYMEQAVALDPKFTVAWADLTVSLANLYNNGTPDPEVARRSKEAAERAVALGPNSGAAHRAMATYLRTVRRDYARAEEEMTLALNAAPNDPTVLLAGASSAASRGSWGEATTYTEKARRLDPRNPAGAGMALELFLRARQLDQALAAGAEALALSPGAVNTIERMAMVYLAKGDLEGARGVISKAPATVARPALLAYFATYYDLYWVLTREDQDLMLRLPHSAFFDDPGAWSSVFMETYWLRGDKVKARAYADTAHAAFLEQLKAAPDNGQIQLLDGLALAYLGRKAEAIAAAERATTTLAISTDGVNGPYFQHQLARVYMLLGENDKAIDTIELLLRVPYVLTPAWLRIDPTFDPLRGNPRFEKLVAGK